MNNKRLKVATWNLGRPTLASKAKNDSILKTLRDVDADILVLTETNACIDLSDRYTSFSTTCLFQSLAIGKEQYKPGENRVTIWSKLAGRRRVDVCNSHSAVCAQIMTDFGELNVYGTVIGIYGKGRGKTEPPLSRTDFETTLDIQLGDWERLAELGSICVAGDFNLSFSDSYYVTRQHRQRVLECFERLDMTVPTKDLRHNIDHIALSKGFLGSVHCEPRAWPKSVSDHQRVCLTIEESTEVGHG
jgi:endonuclease/exonuclease/phosphatase family metal-dependent hydrolase